MLSTPAVSITPQDDWKPKPIAHRSLWAISRLWSSQPRPVTEIHFHHSSESVFPVAAFLIEISTVCSKSKDDDISISWKKRGKNFHPKMISQQKSIASNIKNLSVVFFCCFHWRKDTGWGFYAPSHEHSVWYSTDLTSNITYNTPTIKTNWRCTSSGKQVM